MENLGGKLGGQIWWNNQVENQVGKLGGRLVGKIVWKNWVENWVDKLGGKNQVENLGGKIRWKNQVEKLGGKIMWKNQVENWLENWVDILGGKLFTVYSVHGKVYNIQQSSAPQFVKGSPVFLSMMSGAFLPGSCFASPLQRSVVQYSTVLYWPLPADSGQPTSNWTQKKYKKWSKTKKNLSKIYV